MAKKIQRKFATGGVIESFSSPMLAQGMQGDLSAFGISSPISVFRNGGKTKEFNPYKATFIVESELGEVIHKGKSLKRVSDVFFKNNDTLRGLKLIAVDEYGNRRVLKESTYGEGGEISKEDKIAKVMHEFKAHKLHSGSKTGPIVKSRKQAVAIALSEANSSKQMAKGGRIPQVGDAGIITDKNSMYVGKIATVSDIVDNMLTVFVFGPDGKTKYCIIKKNGLKIIEDDFDEYAKGGMARTTIVGENVDYSPKAYAGVLGDFDKDGLPNADDPDPIGKKNVDSIEQMKFSNTFKELLETRKDLAVDMDKFVTKLQKTTPSSSKIYARTKTPFSILNKLVDSRLLNEKHGLKDLVGTTVTFDNYEELNKFHKMVNEGKIGKVLDYDNYYESPKDGYRAYHFIIEQGGAPIELQLKTNRMKEVNILSHDAYKNKRLNKEYMLYLTSLANEADRGDKEAGITFDEIMSDKHKVEQRLNNQHKQTTTHN